MSTYTWINEPMLLRRPVEYELTAVIRMVNELSGLDLTGRECVLERGQHQVGVRAGRGLPRDD
ncbi:hypothetical protein, partial [Streptomyces aureus]